MEAILDKLFESTAKVRLLKLFLMNPNGQFTMPEVVKQTQLKRQAVKKELAKIMRIGLVKTKIVAIPEVRVQKLKKFQKTATKKKKAVIKKKSPQKKATKSRTAGKRKGHKK